MPQFTVENSTIFLSVGVCRVICFPLFLFFLLFLGIIQSVLMIHYDYARIDDYKNNMQKQLSRSVLS